ncbi:unnamed protein product [Schistosoma mattheei]|uniref:Uncharacterized protein n=1 Tax=Schistosoma mattheei TaxID=31246 RepID=A0A183PDS5_9TREM|nr:unnamed protein product [Schistosoma mattheei]
MSVRRISKKFSVQSVEASELKGAKLSLLGESTEAYAGIPTEVVDEDIEAEDEDNTQLNLFEEDDKTLPPMSNWFGKLAAYTGGIEPTVGETKQLKEKQTKSCDASSCRHSFVTESLSNECFHLHDKQSFFNLWIDLRETNTNEAVQLSQKQKRECTKITLKLYKDYTDT